VENTPVSEVARGVIAVLHALGLPTDRSDVTEARSFLAVRKLDQHIGENERICGDIGSNNCVM
jgi:hypothetical protein